MGKVTLLPVSFQGVVQYPAAPKDLYPVFDPRFNMREVSKQLCLLEDHLNQRRKRCPDCIRKHFLTTEALMEEGIALDTPGKITESIEYDLQRLRVIMRAWMGGMPPRKLAQAVRVIRKQWSKDCFAIGL